MNVSPECDCWGHNDVPLVPDLGDIVFGEQEGEVVDKILYINDPNSDVRIFTKSYKRNMNYNGLADHVPVVVEFGYEKVK